MESLVPYGTSGLNITMTEKKTYTHTFRPLLKVLVILVLLVGFVMTIRYYCIESFQISTDSMNETLHKGDYVLVNKLPIENNPGRNRIVLFTSPLRKDSIHSPLILSRCIGMPGDTIQVNADGYIINGRPLPLSPQALSSYFISQDIKDHFLSVLKKLHIPLRNFTTESFGYMLRLTPFEAYQIREELPKSIKQRFIHEQNNNYTLIIPQKDRAYRLDSTSLIACKEAILNETNGKAVFHDGKLYIDGKETHFFFFKQDYYWMLSDNAKEAVDSRHLGFIPADRIIGNTWFCWFSKNKQRIFKFIN